MSEPLQKLQQEKGEPLKYFLRVNLQAGPVALTKGVLSYFAMGLYHHWLSPAPMGIFLQLSVDTLTALFAMMQRVQGPQKQYVSVYNVPDADREKEAGNRRIDVVRPHQGETLGRAPRYRHAFFSGSPNFRTRRPTERFSPWVGARP